MNIKKPPQKIYKEEDTRRILPTIDVELKKKIEKADIVVKDKKDGIKKERKVIEKNYIIKLQMYILSVSANNYMVCILH
jgi:hypothetical protein